MEDRIKARVSRDRDVNMFGELSHANLVLLQNARRLEDGYFYEFMSCVILAAFKHEAFVNHVGNRLFRPNWRERDRHDDKQARVLNHLGISIDKGRRPFQTLHRLFEARNQLGHGKPETLTRVNAVESGTREELRRSKPQTRWEQACSLDFAECAYEDTEQIAEMVWEKAGFDLHELRSCGHSYSIEEIRHTDGKSSVDPSAGEGDGESDAPQEP